MTLQTIILIMNQQSYKSCRLCCYILYNSRKYRSKYARQYGGPKVSQQFQFPHGNFNLFRAISICSRQFQFVQGNFNLLTAISIYPRQFQFAHGDFNLLRAISQFYSEGNFNFFTATLTAFFASLTTCRLRRPTVATHQKSKRKIKSGHLKSIFKEKSENHKSKVDLRSSRTRGYLHETGTNSDWYEFVSVAIHFLSCVYRPKNELRPV